MSAAIRIKIMGGTDGPDYCERGCYMPRWFKRLGITLDCWLEIAEKKVEIVKKEKEGAK